MRYLEKRKKWRKKKRKNEGRRGKNLNSRIFKKYNKRKKKEKETTFINNVYKTYNWEYKELFRENKRKKNNAR